MEALKARLAALAAQIAELEREESDKWARLTGHNYRQIVCTENYYTHTRRIRDGLDVVHQEIEVFGIGV